MARGMQVEALISGLTDDDGNPLASGKVYSYEAGTSTPKALYQDQTLQTAHPNPLILDAVGKALAFASGTYKFDVRDADDTSLDVHDNLQFLAEEVVWAGTSGSGGSNKFTLTPAPAIAAYTAGLRFLFIAGQSNSGAATLNVSGLGAKDLRKGDGSSAVVTGDIVSGYPYHVLYDGTQFIVLNPSTNAFTYVYGGTSGGSANAQTLSPNPTVANYQAGQLYSFIAGYTNTGGATLNVSSLGAVTIKNQLGEALVGGEIVSGRVYVCKYDGTDMILINPSQSLNDWTPTYGGGGSMTFGSVTTNLAKYTLNAKGLCRFILNATGTTGGSASSSITATLPKTPLYTSHTFAARVADGGGNVLGYATISSISGDGTLSVFKSDTSNWGLGASRSIIVSGEYFV